MSDRNFSGTLDYYVHRISERGILAILICIFAAASAALEAGKHVFVEKPIALSVHEGEQLVQKDRSSSICLADFEQYRINPVVAELDRLIAAGTIAVLA